MPPGQPLSPLLCCLCLHSYVPLSGLSSSRPSCSAEVTLCHQGKADGTQAGPFTFSQGPGPCCLHLWPTGHEVCGEWLEASGARCAELNDHSTRPVEALLVAESKICWR